MISITFQYPLLWGDLMNKLVSLAIAALIFSVILGIALVIDFIHEGTFNRLLTTNSILLFIIGIIYLFLGKRQKNKT